jgi:hypothetical protein
MLYIIKTEKKVVTSFFSREKAEEYVKNHPKKQYQIIEHNW